MGTKLHFNSSYHPQTDGKIEVVNKSVGDLLWRIVEDNPKQWDLVSPQVEFSYNSLVNRSTSKSPFQVDYGRNSMGVLDLVQLLLGDRIGNDGEVFVEHIQQLQQQARKKLQDSNEQKKIIKYSHRPHQVFNEGYLVMGYLRKERFPKGTYYKFKYQKIGPCKILKKINNNAYKVGLPADLNIYPMFNVSNLYIFHGDNLGDAQDILSKKKENIAHILDKHTLHTR